MSRRKVIWISVIVAGVLLAVGGWAALRWREMNAAPATASKAETGPAVSELILPAKLQAKSLIGVPAPIRGTIEVFHVDVGDEVYEGQLLAELKSETLEGMEEAARLDLEKTQARANSLESLISAARLEESRASADSMRVRADLDRLTRLYERQKLLLREGAIPRLTFEKTERDFQAAEIEFATLQDVSQKATERIETLNRDLDAARKILAGKEEEAEQARARIQAGQVLAPVGGTVSGRRGQVGETIGTETTDFIQIATDLSTLQAVADMDKQQAALIRAGQEVLVVVAESGHALSGVVTSAVEGKVTVEFVNPHPDVKPGVTAQIRIKIT